MSSVYVETDKGKAIAYQLLNPHYTDGRFRQIQTVFLAPGYKTVDQFGTDMVECASYDYSDRLEEWHSHELREAAWKAAESKGFEKNSAAVIEAFLRELFEDPDLSLVHIVAGVNLGNGYAYRVYGYIRKLKSN